MEVVIYTGEDGSFTLYEDKGDGYDYEEGKYTAISFHWNEDAKNLTINKLQGSFQGGLKPWIFKIIWINGDNASGKNFELAAKSVKYVGNKISIKMKFLKKIIE